MYAMEIVPPEGEEHEDSSGARAETFTRGDRWVWRYSVHDSFVLMYGKFILVTTLFRQQP